MPKFFVVSDVHGFYDEMVKSLTTAGFDADNEEHWLIGCGDYLDRGRQPLEMINFWKNINRKIMVRGNHEELFEALCNRMHPKMHDWHNGTMQTISDLTMNDKCDEMYHQALYKFEPLLNSMVNFFETQHYVFVHSTIPMGLEHDWRNSTEAEWNNAMWESPFDFWEHVGIEDKTVVFGHWNTSYYNSPSDEFGENANFGIAYGDGFIGLDACTAYSHKVNVLVIEDDFLDEEQ